jgi:hypothetical protein
MVLSDGHLNEELLPASICSLQPGPHYTAPHCRLSQCDAQHTYQRSTPLCLLSFTPSFKLPYEPVGKTVRCAVRCLPCCAAGLGRRIRSPGWTRSRCEVRRNQGLASGLGLGSGLPSRVGVVFEGEALRTVKGSYSVLHLIRA